jgi:release factor glutamine methyltransferase
VIISSKTFAKNLSKRLQSYYAAGEAQAIAQFVLEELANINKTALLLDQTFEPTEALLAVENKLATGLPLQYALGYGYFLERKFKVDKHCLIPRPETEQLVGLCLEFLAQYKSENLKILDIGTGSGCIAISLALASSNSQVRAMDISAGALTIAKKNAQALGAVVAFEEQNILNFSPLAQPTKYHLIVSNPPYVTNAEKQIMARHVLDYEPHTALFVANNEPLVFYKKICEFAQKQLADGGGLFFEINEKYGPEVAHLMKNTGFEQIQIHQDIHQKQRFASAIWRPAV